MEEKIEITAADVQAAADIVHIRNTITIIKRAWPVLARVPSTNAGRTVKFLEALITVTQARGSQRNWENNHDTP